MKIVQPSDFLDDEGYYLSVDSMAEMVNSRFSELIESWPTWYADRSMRELTPIIQDEKNHIAISSNFRNSYYQFKMAFIKPIKNEPCKHEPVLASINAIYRPQGRLPEDENYKCKHCGVELEVTWREKT